MKLNQAVKIGLAGGFLIAGFGLLSFTALADTLGPYARYVILVLYFITIYIGVRRTRDFEFEGNITFKPALKAGMTAAVISSLMYAPVVFGMYRYQFPYLILKGPEKVLPYQFAALSLDSGFATQTTIMYIIQHMLMGFMVTLMAAMVLRKRQ